MLSRLLRLKRLILKNSLSPGDIVMLTAAVRDLHRCYPECFVTDVRTSCSELWENNPFITPLDEKAKGVKVLDCHYPLIHQSNEAPFHCIHGFIQDLNAQLKLKIRPTVFKGDIHISELEKSWFSQVHELTCEDTPFWIVVSGGKYDYTTKWWAAERYQQVVDHFRDRILFVQVGANEHHHPPLEGVIDLRGKTDLRQLVRLVYHSQGVLCPVTSLMHLAAAIEVKGGIPRNRPCVDVTPASFQAWRKDKSAKAPKTLNEYLATLSAFWTWLRKQGRVSTNPFELVERTDTRGKERVQRRALSDAEVSRLLEAAGDNQLAYMLPLYTGLRRNEVRTLRWSNLVLGEFGGLLRIHAAVNKNRKDQALPLHPELAKALRRLKPVEAKETDLVVVNGVPKMKEFRQDLAKAGIPFLDERGRRMDYHALRTTFITRLSTMKVHPRVAMELARHSDLRLTMKTYTDAGQLPLREAMESLPGFSTKSDSRIDSRNLGPTGQSVSPSVQECGVMKIEKHPVNADESHALAPTVTTCHTEPGAAKMEFESPSLRQLFSNVIAVNRETTTSSRDCLNLPTGAYPRGMGRRPDFRCRRRRATNHSRTRASVMA